MDIIEIRRMLAEGFCNLQYVKKDGTTRAATGEENAVLNAFARGGNVEPENTDER